MPVTQRLRDSPRLQMPGMSFRPRCHAPPLCPMGRQAYQLASGKPTFATSTHASAWPIGHSTTTKPWSVRGLVFSQLPIWVSYITTMIGFHTPLYTLTSPPYTQTPRLFSHSPIRSPQAHP